MKENITIANLVKKTKYHCEKSRKESKDNPAP